MKLFFPTSPAGAADDTSRFGIRMFAILDDLFAVHKDVSHTGGVLMRLLVRRIIADSRRIENGDVGVIIALETTALAKFQRIGGEKKKAAKGFPPPEDFF